MEQWQKMHITKHFDELIQNTLCTFKFIAILHARNILSTNDMDLLETCLNSKGKFAQAVLLFQIAMTRTNAFSALAFGLHAIKQTGASRIFEIGYKSQGIENPVLTNKIDHAADIESNTKWSDLAENLVCDILTRRICFMDKETTLSCILEKLPVDAADQLFTATTITDTLNYDREVNISTNLPERLRYYVPRSLEPRKRLQPGIFDVNCEDVFAFKTIGRSSLTEIARGRSTDRSTNQTEDLTVRFILLEHEEDFIKMSELGAAAGQAVHLLEYRDGGVYWVQSHGDISVIQKFVDERPENLSEERFISECLKSPHSQPVCLSDSPGMGKTVLLANLGREILSQRPESVVLYIVLREFVQHLETGKIDDDQVYDTLSKQASDTGIGQNILKHCLLSEAIECELLFDGFDEVLTYQLATTKNALKSILKLKGTRIYVTTRPHMREELEKLLGVLGHNIHPFQEEDQIEFLERYWAEMGGCRNERMRMYVEACLGNLKKDMTDFERDFAGIPLQCRLLAEVHSENAIKYSNSKVNVALSDFGVNISLNSIFMLYKRMLEMKFNGKEHLLNQHVFLAMELLFPEWKSKLHLKADTYSDEDVCNVGVLERKYLQDILRFIHRTLAEFLVAKFVIENSSSEDEFWQFFLAELLATVEMTELPVRSHGFGEWVKVDSARYKYPVIAYFINAHLRDRNTAQLSSNQTFKIPSQGRKYCNHLTFPPKIAAAVCHNFQNLTQILADFNKNFLQISLEKLSSLLLLCAKHGNTATFEQFCGIEPQTSNNLQRFEFQRCRNTSFMITPLHVAVQIGKYKLVEHLINNCGYGEILSTADLPCLAHMCVFKSRLDKRGIANKTEIVRLLHSRNPDYVNEELGDRTTPLLQLLVHPDLLQLLIQLGANVNCVNNKRESVLHTVFRETTTENRISVEEYNKLLSKVIEKGYIQFNLKAQGLTPLHVAVSNLEIDEQTIKCFAENGADLNATDDNNDSILFATVKGGRSRNILKSLVELGADINHRNKVGQSVLHIAATYGNLDGVEAFHHSGVNAIDNDLNTPLHWAVTQAKTKNNECIRMLLLEKGAAIQATNGNGHVPLIHGMVHGKGLSWQVITEMEARGLVISEELASMALKHHIVNRIINNWGEDWVHVADFFILKHGQLSGNEGQNPWELEEVRENMRRVEARIVWEGPLIREIRRRQLLDNEHTQAAASTPNALLSLIKSKGRSFELLLISLVAAEQVKSFQILRQSFQSHVLGSSRFMTPPPGMDEFMESKTSRVLVISSINPELTIERIQETVDSELQVLHGTQDQKCSQKGKSNVALIAASSQLQLLEDLNMIKGGDWEKRIYVVTDTEQLPDLPHNMKLFREEIRWSDLTGSCRKKLRGMLQGSSEVSKNIDFFNQLSTRDICILIKIGDNLNALFPPPREDGLNAPFRICRRATISESIFEHFVGDLLIFKGAFYDDLKALTKWGHKVARSGDQVQIPEPDFVVLEEETHVQRICEETERNVHLLEWREDHLELAWSRGSVLNICQHLEGSKLGYVEMSQYFRTTENVVLLQSEILLWGSFVEMLRLERRGEGVLFAFLDDDNLKLEKFATFCEGNLESEKIFEDLIRLFFGGRSASVIDSTSGFTVFNIVLGLYCVIARYDLVLLKRVIGKVSKWSKNIRFWIIVCRDIYRLEQVFDIRGHELREISKEEQVLLISDAWGRKNGSLDFEIRAKTALKEYESQVVSKQPVASLRISSKVGDLLPMSSVANPLVYSTLIAKLGRCLKSEVEVSSMCEQVLEDFVKSVAGGEHLRKELAESVRVKLMRIGMRKFYPEWMNVFVDMEGCEGSVPAENASLFSRAIASYMLANLVVDCAYAKYLNQDRLVQYFRQVVFRCVGVNASVFENYNLCYFLNCLLEKGVNEYFSCLIERVQHEWGELRKCVNASVVGSCLNILRVFVDVGGNALRQMIDDELVGLAVAFGDLDTVKFVCDMYLEGGGKSLSQVNVKFKMRDWPLMYLSLMRGDHDVFKHLIQHAHFKSHLVKWCLHNCVVDSLFDNDRVIKHKRNIIQYLVELSPECLQDKYDNGVTPLHMRCVHLELCKLLVSLGVDINAARNDGSVFIHLVPDSLTPAHYHDLMLFLVSQGKTDCFKHIDNIGCSVLHDVRRIQVLPETLEIFHSHHLDFNLVTKDGNSVLHCAVQGKAGATLLNKLIDLGANLGARHSNLCVALHDAAQFGNSSGIRVLLERGCEINPRSNYGNTPLHYAFLGNSKHNLLDIIRIFLDNGADITAKDNNGRTFLHYACMESKSDDWLKAIKLLWKRGADLRAKDTNGLNMLHVARLGRTAEEFHELIAWILDNSNGNILQERSDFQCTPLHHAVLNLELKESTLDLMMNYVDINDVDKSGFNVIFYAVEGNRGYNFLQMLVRNGADWRKTSDYQFTLLHHASRFENVEALRHFLSKGCDVNARDYGKNSPLHWAFKEETDKVYEIASVLMENGADVNAKNSDGFTPVDLASEMYKNGTLELQTLKLLKSDASDKPFEYADSQGPVSSPTRSQDPSSGRLLSSSVKKIRNFFNSSGDD